MLYQRYEDRIKRIAKIKVAVYKYRFPILIGICLLLILTGYLLIKKGTIKSDLSIAPSAIYGESYSCSAEVFLGEPSYQYKIASNDDGEWMDGLPILAGEYKVRLKTRRTFGFSWYGEEKDFSILPAKLSVRYKTRIKFGDEPVSGFSTVYNDKVGSYRLNKDVFYVGTESVGLADGSVVVFNADGVDVSFCYFVDYEQRRDITVSKKPITVSSGSFLKTYDGEPLTNGDAPLIVGGEGLLPDHTITCDFTAEITEPGETFNSFENVRIFDGENDVSENYDVNVLAYSGKLTVNKIALNIDCPSATWIYDGEIHFGECYFDTEDVLSFHDFEYDKAYLFKVGTISNYSTVVIKRNGVDITNAYYSVTYTRGNLKIEPKTVNVSSPDLSYVYDAYNHYVSEFSFDGLVEADASNIDYYTPYIRTVSSIKNVPTDFYVVNPSYGDVTGCYVFNTDGCGTLEITKRPITFTSYGDERIYDATALTKHLSYLSDGSLAGSEYQVYLFTGSQTDVGRSENTFSVNIFGGAQYTTSNYEVSYIYGTLTVNKRPITVKTADLTKEYDATPLTNNGEPLTVGGYGLVSWHTLYAEFTGGQTDVGYSPNSVKDNSVEILSYGLSVTENYDITFTAGTLTVEKRGVRFTLFGNKVYDGTDTVNQGHLTLYTELLVDGYYTEMQLYGGQRAEYSCSLSVSDAGTYFSPVWSSGFADIVDGSGQSKKDNYNVIWRTDYNSYFTIEKKHITILTNSHEWTFDRLAHYDEGYAILEGGTVSGQQLIVQSHTEITTVGNTDNALIFDIVYNNVSKKHNYDIDDNLINGILKINPIELDVGIYGEGTTYNGEPQFLDLTKIYIAKGYLLEGDSVSLSGTNLIIRNAAEEIVNSPINAGTYTYSGDGSACVFVYGDSHFADYYKVQIDGELDILKAEITVASKTDNKPYDGAALTANDFEIKSSPISGGLASGDTISVLCGGSQTEKGESQNFITYIHVLGHGAYDEIIYPSDKTVWSLTNYTLNVEFGTLTVT